MNCKYSYKGVNIGTIEDLYRYLDGKNLIGNDIEDILFSAETRQSSQCTVIQSIKASARDNFVVNTAMIEEDSGFRGENGEFSLCEFFDNSGEAIINGKRLCKSLDREEYRLRKIMNYQKKRGYSLEAAQALTDNELNSWETITKFGQVLHRIGISKYIGGTEDTENQRKADFIKQARNIAGDTIQMSDEFLEKLFNELTRFYKTIKDGNSNCFRGINITSKLKNSNTKLFSHIDYAIIDSRGNLHIYNFKVSSQYSGDWSEEKKEKYELELAFIKQMLSDNGLDITGISLHHIPVKLDFNPDFSEVNNVLVFENGLGYKQSYDNIAKYFINSSRVIFTNPDDKEMENNKRIFNAIFPTQQITNKGIEKSVKDWIRRAPAFGEEQPVTIREIDDGEHRYVVTINGKPHLISDFTDKENNKQILELIEKYISNLNEDFSNKANDIANAIQRTFDNNLSFFDFSKISEGKSYLNVMLKKYIENTSQEVNGTEIRNYKWKLHDNLVDSGILIFENNSNHQFDIIVLSTKNLNSSPEYKYGSNILGGYLTDRDFQWRGTYGNVETVRGMVMLNSIIPKLPEGFRLGEINVISSQGMSYRYNIEHIAKDYMKDIYKITKRKNPTLQITNNFKSVNYVDHFTDLVNSFTSIISVENSASNTLREIVGEKLKLQDASDESKRAALLSIMESFQEQFPEIAANPLLTLRDSNKYQRDLASFFIQLSQAYLYYSNERVSYEEELTTVDKYMYTAPTIPNSNINIIVTNLQKTIDNISEECDTEYSKNIRQFVMDFYKSAGYTSLENFTLGTQNRLFTNLYQTDSKGKRMLVFKNPYTDPSLKDYERTFLKKALFYFNKYRFKDEDNKNFSSWDDPEIPKYILSHGDYLNVPLKRASEATHRQRLSIQDKVDNMKRILKVIVKSKGKNLYNEFVEGLTEDEAEYYRTGFESMRFKDPFNRTDEQRREYIEKNGINYFETNVEDLLTERLFNSIYTEKINRMLLGTKALLLQMSILGENSYTENTFEQEQKFIKDYIGLHVFKRPITEKGVSQRLVGIGQGLRKGVSFLNLAGNVIAAARDIENGFMENYIRTASKYMTDISAKNLSNAYTYVFRNGSMDAMKMTLLSKLCVRYRLSNTDTARIVERLKTGRQGLANWDNIAYSTLRAPDFLNRMSLFIAKAMQDGVLDAWSVKDGELIYDWRKDKRFSLLTSDANKNNPEYKKQKALYMLCIKEWNNDHPDKQQLNYSDDLPSPYSNQEILAIKQVSDNIYGSYDRMTRGMADFTAAGCFFGMYTTWMNGIWNNWMMKPGKYNVHRMTTEQETDIDGNLIFQDENRNQYVEKTAEDGTKQYVNEDSGETKDISELIPVLKHVPIPVQGVIYTLKDAARILKHDGIQDAIKYVTDDPNTIHSLVQLAITAALAALFAMLFKFVLDPAYAETKKAYKDMDSINILLTELAYRPLNPATDSLYGILNVVKYLGDGMDPPLYNVPTKLITDTWKTAFGNKTTEQFISQNFAFARIYKQLANVNATNAS